MGVVCGTPELYRLITSPLLNVLAPEDVVVAVVVVAVVMLCVAGS